MMFWDSSALVPLCLDQPRSPEARTLAGEDAEMVVWWGSAIASGTGRTSCPEASSSGPLWLAR